MNRPWPTTNAGWVLAVVALILEILLVCGVHVPYGMLTPLIMLTIAVLA